MYCFLIGWKTNIKKNEYMVERERGGGQKNLNNFTKFKEGNQILKLPKSWRILYNY